MIIGAGGHAREAAALVDDLNTRAPELALRGFVVDAAFGEAGVRVDERPIVGDFGWLAAHAGEVEVLCAVGAPELRRRLVERATAAGARFCRLLHPSAVLARDVEIGAGAMIGAGCVLTVGVTVGAHAHVNVACTLSHDVVLEPFATLAPGVHAAGGAVFGEGCNVGVGAVVIPQRRVGAWSIVGAGSAVVEDVPADTVVAGVPARPLRSLAPGWHLV